MTLSRRSFLTACIASACAPAIVRASSLMALSITKPERFVITETFTRGYTDPRALMGTRPIWPGTIIPGAYSAWVYDGTHWVESKDLQTLGPPPGTTAHFKSIELNNNTNLFK